MRYKPNDLVCAWCDRGPNWFNIESIVDDQYQSTPLFGGKPILISESQIFHTTTDDYSKEINDLYNEVQHSTERLFTLLTISITTANMMRR